VPIISTSLVDFFEFVELLDIKYEVIPTSTIPASTRSILAPPDGALRPQHLLAWQPTTTNRWTTPRVG
jgi:hypothetical protein